MPAVQPAALPSQRREAKPGKPGALRGMVRYCLIMGLICFVLLEILARIVTGTGGNGMPVVSRFPLLPYRPSPALLAESLAVGKENTYIVTDPELGWTIKADGVALRDGVPFLEANGQGVRTRPDRVFTSQPAEGVVRITTIGDSFTHCDEVANDETWQHYLEHGTANAEVLNLGGPGYGTDQALMRWRRDGRPFQSKYVILGIWPENMCRNLNIMRYYLVPSGNFQSKPRMVPNGAGLDVINSPVMSLEKLAEVLAEPERFPILGHDFWFELRETQPRLLHWSRCARIASSISSLYQRKQTRADIYSGARREGIDITVAIAREFKKEVEATGAEPVVLMIPSRDLLDQHTAPEPFPLVAALRKAGIRVIDLGPTLGSEIQKRGIENCYMPKGHHKPELNEFIAHQIGLELEL